MFTGLVHPDMVFFRGFEAAGERLQANLSKEFYRLEEMEGMQDRVYAQDLYPVLALTEFAYKVKETNW